MAETGAAGIKVLPDFLTLNSSTSMSPEPKAEPGLTGTQGSVHGGGSSFTMAATDSSAVGQEYDIYGQGGAIISVICPGCTIDLIFNSFVAKTYRMSAMSGRSIIKGGSHGLFLTGASTTGYGVDLSQASGYNITITNPAAILGGQGKFGTSGSTANQINAGGVVITTGTTGPYPVNISLNAIPDLIPIT